MRDMYYLFENDQGLWLKEGTRTEVTSNPNKAAKLKDKFEATLFCSGLSGFKVTEHEFVPPKKNRCIECEIETDNEVWCDMHTPLI
jgi:hypothetical protein